MDRCTCGTVLVEDALFCHKCGRPTRELVSVEPEAPPPLPPPVPEVVVPPPIGFQNGVAVRIGLLAGVISIVFSSPIATVAPPLAIVSLAAAGWLAVFLYRWRTGQRLSARSGAHLGWICGVFGFAISAVLTALRFSEPAATDTLRAQWKQLGMSEAQVSQALNELHNPLTLVLIVLFAFAMFTALPAFGGAIGAKLLDRDSS